MQTFKTILVIPDRHQPFQHIDTLPFIKALISTYQPDAIIDLGDEVDLHSQNFHQAPDPDLPYSASSELATAIEYQKGFYDVVGRTPCYVCNSNHGSLFYRRLKANGIPRSITKPWQEIMEAPNNFLWADRHIFNSGDQTILFQHSIKSDSLASSKHKGISTVQGHFHTRADIRWWANDLGGRYFGATTGCLVDEDSLALAYGKLNADKVILGAMVIIFGVPILVPMLLTDGRWNRAIL